MLRVSGTASKRRVSSSISTTVRQQPEMLMESPTAASGASLGARTARRAPGWRHVELGDLAELLHDAGEHARRVSVAACARARWGRRAATSRQLAELRLEQEVGADRARAQVVQRGRVGERVDAERSEEPAPVAADHERGDEQGQRVDETGSQETRRRARRRPRRAATSRRALRAPGAPPPASRRPAARCPAAAPGLPPVRRARCCRSTASGSPRGVRGGRRRPAAAGARPATSTSRASRDGSSASAVPLPTATASIDARHSWTSRRLSSEEIQRLSPDAVAVRPSSDAASLSSTNGRPSTAWMRNAAFCRLARRSSSPVASSTSTPASRRRAKPLPPTFCEGSPAAQTTRAIPASISASAQGG